MKKVIVSVFAVMAMLFAGSAAAQVSHGGEPLFNHSYAKMSHRLSSLPALDNEKFINEDLSQVKGAGPMRVGIRQMCDIDVLANSAVVKNDDGVRYLMAVTSPEATFVSLFFSDFQLPEGATLFVYDQSGDFVLGSFNRDDVNADGSFYTQVIPGSVAYIEYFVPAGVDAGSLVLSDVEHGYKDIFGTMDGILDDAEAGLKGPHGTADGTCHINVACPEGDDWRDQIRSVVAIAIYTNYASYMCSGALVNNTRQDRTPYVLSAYHCQDEEAIGSAVTRFTAYFLYETKSCTATTGSYSKSVTGADIMAKYSSETGSDFLLLKLRNSVPDGYTPYYAGWDCSTATSHTPGMAIHHPGGDYKKLSVPSSIIKATGSLSKFFKVNWYTGTQNKGVTEQGSSGSPLFNSDKRIVGQLFGGTSACNNTSGYDYYGRLAVSWDGNNTDQTSLRPWLDPENTGVTTFDGIDYTDSSSAAVPAVERRGAKSLEVYPNPSNGKVCFNVDALGSADYKVYDISGRCVKEGRTVLTSTVQAIDLGTLPRGTYVLRLVAGSAVYEAAIIRK